MTRSYGTSATLISALLAITVPAHSQTCNIAIGFQTLQSASNCGNVGIGPGATLDNTTTGYSNTGVGSGALHLNVYGYLNSAYGANALSDNTSGNNNTAVGFEALFSNSNGNNNVATGFYAIAGNTTGSFNTASGNYALAGNTIGNYNTASGNYALAGNSTGNENTAVGNSAMYYNQTGSNNTALGSNALNTNHGGSHNLAVGSSAGYNVRGGNYNIEIGNVGTANDAATIRIGTSNQQSAAYIAGIANAHVTGSAVYVTSTGQLGVLASSERYKTHITSMGERTGKLKQLRPVAYQLKNDPKGSMQYGLIAEEVAKVYPELVIRGERGEIEGVRYEELTPMLLNELQQQQGRLADQQSRLADQQGRLAEQQAELQDMRSQLADLRRALQERTH